MTDVEADALPFAQRYAAAADAVASSPTRPSLAGEMDPATLTHLPGEERMRATLRGDVPPPPTWYLLGFDLVEVGPKRVTFELQPLPGHSNYAGTMHGGLITALADSAMACAVVTVLEPEAWCATLELKMNLLRPVGLDGGVLRAEGSVRAQTKTTALAEVTMSVDGKEVAVGNSTYVIRGNRKLAGGPSLGDGK
jgi:uncharacterized protein (TIGR00369 family)